MAPHPDQPGAVTLSEILSQPACWRECLAILEARDYVGEMRRGSGKTSEWMMIGCGSSYYAAMVAADSWRALTRERTQALPASEILLFPEMALPISDSSRPILISRSGRPSEVLKAAEYFNHGRHVQPVAISCVAGQALEGLSGLTVVLPPADEKSMVMTRSFTSMVLALQYLAAGWAGNTAFQQALKELPAPIEKLLLELPARVENFVSTHDFEDYVFLGQGPFYGVANEAMLKVKEMSCSYAQCFHTLEFRHGPKAIVSPRTLVTFFISEAGFSSEIDLLEEVKSLGAVTLVVVNRAEARVRAAADFVVELGLDVPEFARPVASIPAGQLLGLFTGRKKGINSDRPPNLSRAVILQD